MRKLLLLIIICLPLLAVSCNKAKDEPVVVDPVQVAKSQESIKKFEERKKLLEEQICPKKTSELTGIEFAQCRDLKENSLWYEDFGGRESDLDFSYLPEFCKRKLSEMIGNEMVDCLAEEPEAEEDENY